MVSGLTNVVHDALAHARELPQSVRVVQAKSTNLSRKLSRPGELAFQALPRQDLAVERALQQLAEKQGRRERLNVYGCRRPSFLRRRQDEDARQRQSGSLKSRVVQRERSLEGGGVERL